jgi:hypothetical protein
VIMRISNSGCCAVLIPALRSMSISRNLVIFRPRTLPMRCTFCGRQHYWRLIKYDRPDIQDMERRHRAPSTLRQKRASHLGPSTPGSMITSQR